MRSLVAASLVLGLARVAAAGCAPVDRYTATEQAARAVVGRVQRQQGGYQAAVVVEQVVKGAAEPRRLMLTYNPLSGGGFDGADRFLVFLDDKGALIGGCSTVALDRRAEGLVESLVAWQQAKDDVARATVLLRSALRDHAIAGTDAMMRLAGSPATLGLLSLEDRDRLRGAVKGSEGERAYALAWALGRLHETKSVRDWIEWLGRKHTQSNARPIQDALELLTNHHDPRYTPGIDFGGATQAELRAGWSRWLHANEELPRQRYFATGFAKRGYPGLSVETEAEAAKVVRGNYDALSRTVALVACEQRLRAPRSRLGHGWTTVQPDDAKACEAP